MVGSVQKKNWTMKNWIAFLLLAFSATVFSQEKIYNVQWYCVDEKPFAAKQCDISGNEYSFVFLDEKKQEVVFFFTSMKIKYAISSVDKTDKGFARYDLIREGRPTEMRIYSSGKKIEFHDEDRLIELITGASTKLGHR